MPLDHLTARRSSYPILTGHPPPLQQIANQVRTPTGYTLGTATADGARLSGVTAPDKKIAAARKVAAAEEADRREAERQQHARDCADVLAWLQRAEQRLPRPTTGRRDVRRLPTLYSVAQEIGATWSLARLMGALQRLDAAGALAMVTEAKGRRGAAIKLRESSLTLVTTSFSDDVRFT